jgi:serine/threonine-protein kinase ATR
MVILFLHILGEKSINKNVDTLRTHVRGVLVRNPEWKSALIDFNAESAWMVGDWDDVRTIVQDTETMTASTVMARLLLALGSDDLQAIESALATARSALGAPVVAAGIGGYRRAYDAILNLHSVHELQLIYDAICRGPAPPSSVSNPVMSLATTLSARFKAISPTFRMQEPVLSLRRTAFALL